MDCDTVERLIGAAIRVDDMDELDRLIPVLDGLDTPRPAPQLLSSALWYAQQGLHVFALRPRSKIPHPGSHGLDDGSTTPDVIREMWARNPNSNIGLVTGHPLDVIDIDGPAGVKSWAELIGTGSLPPIRGIVSTPRGTHLYIDSTGLGNKAGWLPGVDYRGKGGYVVVPPSVSADGVRYRWDRPLAGIS